MENHVADTTHEINCGLVGHECNCCGASLNDAPWKGEIESLANDPLNIVPGLALLDFQGFVDLHPALGGHSGSRKDFGFYRRGYVFQVLLHSPAVRASIPGAGTSLLTLGLISGCEIDQDLSSRFSWEIPVFKQFVADVRHHDLIDDELAQSLLQAVVPRSGCRRKLSKYERTQIFGRTNGRCVYCACHLTMHAGFPNSFHVDHVLAVTLGGSDDIANLVPACAACNSEKSSFTLLQFAKRKRDEDMLELEKKIEAVKQSDRGCTEEEFCRITKQYLDLNAVGTWWSR